MEIYNINNITGSISIQSSATPKRPEISANGGGFLDDVTNVKSLSISEHQLLPDKSKTSHNDLGFWICAEIDIEDLNEEQQHGIKEYYANQRKVINASIMDV